MAHDWQVANEANRCHSPVKRTGRLIIKFQLHHNEQRKVSNQKKTRLKSGMQQNASRLCFLFHLSHHKSSLC
jgi:hypothetical protein